VLKVFVRFTVLVRSVRPLRRRENTMETLSVDDLSDAIEKLRGISGVERDDESLSFKYRDKDGDNVTVIVKLVDEERVSILLPIAIPESHIASAMIVSNAYNSMKSSFGTFAYASVVASKPFMFLESNICTSGGVDDANLRIQIRNFINHIDNYETVMLSSIKELGPDSDFLKGSSSSEFFRAVGQIAEGMLEALIDQ
jgi:hypothetical protein